MTTPLQNLTTANYPGGAQDFYPSRANALTDAQLVAVQALMSGAGIGVLLTPNASDAATRTANGISLNAALALGGTILVPQGKFYFNTNAISATKPGRLQGQGANNGAYFFSLTQAGSLAEQQAATIFATVSRTGWLFGIDTSGFEVTGVHFQNESAVNGSGIATAGGGIRVGSFLASTGMPSSQANAANIHDCSCYGFWVNIDFYSADSYKLNNNQIINWVSRAIVVRNLYNPNTSLVYDYGDPIISGNQIATGIFSGNTVAMEVLSGGGWKIIGNKINGNGIVNTAYYLSGGILFAEQANTATGVCTIVGNSIENVYDYGIRIDCTNANASLSQFSITGNEFLITGFSVSGRTANYVLDVTSGTQVPFGIYFGQNVINGCYTLVRSNYFSGAIGPNVVTAGDPGGALLQISNGPYLSYSLSEQTVLNRPAGAIMVSDNTSPNVGPTNAPRAKKDQSVYREFPAATIGAATNLFQVWQAISNGNSANTIEVTFEGLISGIGAYTCGVKRVVYGNGASVAAVLTPTGWSDFSHAPNSALPTFQYLTWGFVNTSGILSINATPTQDAGSRLTTAFSGVVSGTVYLKINGVVQVVTIS